VETTVAGPAPVRVLALARAAQDLPQVTPWGAEVTWCTLLAGVGEAPLPRRPYPVTRVRPDPPDGGGERWRVGAARVKTSALAARAGAPAEWLWTLKRSTWLRREVRRVDVLWSLDTDTDAALRAAPDLAGGTVVVTSSEADRVARALRDLAALLEDLAGDRAAAPGGLTDGLAAWQATAAAVAAAGVPPVMLPVERAAEVARGLLSRAGRLSAATVVSSVLDAVPWASAPRGVSGLAAQRAAADLTLARPSGAEPDEGLLAAAAHAALDGADDALESGDGAVALARLGDAMALLFHRERHAEVPRSALAEDPGTYLGSLRRSRTLQALLHAEPVTRRPRVVQDRDLRVLVVTGSYGSFHAPVVHALAGAAEVRVADLADTDPLLSRKLMDTEVLPHLAALVAECGGQRLPGVPAPDRQGRQTLRRVRADVRWADVVVSDWADRSTVWVSHLCPPDVRLVVRVHALDALDPWLHLVRWEAVEQVVVVSEPMRSLVTDILTTGGVDVPVTVLPNLVRLEALDTDKDDTARTTLGMVGWGRKVKDPLWALDLLERDPSWHLVLVGSDFRDVPPQHPAAAYVQRFRARAAEPHLRGRVHVVGFTPDVAEPLRRIGVILSTSVRESWHLGLVEGAMSGAVPVVRNWPLLASRGGARALFPDEWVVDDVDEAEARVRAVTDPSRWPQERARARAAAIGLFDPEQVGRAYRELVLGGPERAAGAPGPPLQA
jgi:glycosyltransferase involved in cell wall biosynthesis